MNPEPRAVNTLKLQLGTLNLNLDTLKTFKPVS
jgi:hypothetical protein